MPSQVPTVAAAVVVPGYQVLGDAYSLVYGANIVVYEKYEEDLLRKILYWSRFKIESQLVLLDEDGLDSFSDVRTLTEKDTITVDSGFENRKQGNGRFRFGTRRTKSLKALVHWVQNLYSTSEEPNIKGLNQIAFLSQLEISLARNEVRI